MNKTVINEFYDYLSEILSVYEDILPVIKQELEAIKTRDMISLNENLKVQQALMHGTKDFDRKVSDYIEKLNMREGNLSSLIQQIPEDRQLHFCTIVGRFAKVVQDVAFYKDKCRLLLTTELHNIDKALSAKGTVMENRTYEKDAKAVNTKIFKSFEAMI